MSNIYCSYDNLNIKQNDDGTYSHVCKHFGTYICDKCGACYDGDKIKQYMEDNPREH